MKLNDYEIPQYGPGDGLGHEDLEQYSLKNFDLKAYQLAQNQPDPDPIPAPDDPYLLKPETDRPGPLAPARAAPSPAPNPVQTELSQLALDPYEVQFGAHFNLQTVTYSPLSPAQSWKLPRWVVAMVGLFFGSAALLTLAFCVALLRDPKPAPAGQLAAPTAPVATTPAAPPQRTSSPPMNKTPGDGTAHLMRNDPAPRHRIAVSRHPIVVRRQVYGPRHGAPKSTSSSVAAEQTETASRPPPKDALDQLLSESSL